MTALPPGLRVPADKALATDDVLDLGILLRALWRAKWALGLAAMIGAAMAILWLQNFAQPLYRATAVVMMEPQMEKMVDLTSVLPGLPTDNTAVNTEVEVLSSRTLLAQVAGALGLARDPEFNAALRQPHLLDRALAYVTARLGLRVPPPVPESQTAILDALSDALTVRNVPDSMVFELTAEARSPHKAALIANTLSELYLERQMDLKFAATEQATQWLSERVADLQIELEAAETTAQSFAAEMELINPETLALLSQQLKEVRQRIAARETAIARTGRENPRDRAQLETLRGLEGNLAQKISRQSLDLVTLEQLQREATASRLIYEFFLSRLKETSVQQGIQTADSTILSEAEIPPAPSRPRSFLVILFCAVLATLAMGALVLRREATRDTFRNAEELEGFSEYTVLGQIPQLPGRTRNAVLGYLADKPKSQGAEAFRNLRISVFQAAKPPPKVIMVTSSGPGEGKTTLALGMATTMAQLGKRVLVIEGDVRRRTFRSYFSKAQTPGLLAALNRTVTLEDAVWQADQLGIDILSTDKAPANAADLFAGPAFEALIRDARSAYDLIVIDTPPVLVVPDARVIGAQADAVLYAVLWDQTGRRQLRAGLHSLHTVGLSVNGLVLSKIHPRQQRAYGNDSGFQTSGYYQT